VFIYGIFRFFSGGASAVKEDAVTDSIMVVVIVAGAVAALVHQVLVHPSN
jgi:LytS/YehU family sensor histidine kinase